MAVAHVTFKIVGVLHDRADSSPTWPSLYAISRRSREAGLVGMDKLAAETPRQIANAHTMFNVGIAIVFLPQPTCSPVSANGSFRTGRSKQRRPW